jgi:RNA polymerase sigma-70 factor, ECF subfamily
MNHDERPLPDHSLESTAFLRLFTAAQPHVFAYIFTLLPNWNDAEEVLQETSLTLWRSFGEFQEGTNFRAWACKTAYYQVLSLRKRRKRAPVLISPEAVEVVAEEIAEMAGTLDDQLRALSGCVGKLRPDDRSVLDRFYGSGLPVKRIAEELGRPVGTITKTLTRIRRALFACIERTLATEESR